MPRKLARYVPRRALALSAAALAVSASAFGPGYLGLTLLGGAAAFINIVAGGGSLVLIPALTFLGYSVEITNGTIRLQILVQGVVALWAYRQSGLFDRAIGTAAPFVMAGAALGVLFITNRPSEDVRVILGLAVILAATFTVWTLPKARPKHVLLIAAAAAASGFYGGMVQAGTGYLFLTTATLVAGMSLPKANFAKIFWATAYAPLTIYLFYRAGHVHWPMAIAIALGAVPGATFGSVAAIHGGAKFLRRAVLLSAVVGGTYLLLG